MSPSPSTLAAPASPVKTAASPLMRWVPLALFSILWLDLCRLLSSQWEAREQYAYGWFVPIFAAVLFLRRWPDRPAENHENGNQKTEITRGRFFCFPLSAFCFGPRENDESRKQKAETTNGRHFSFQLSAFCFLLLLLPLRVIYEINRDWPLVSWLYAGLVVAATLYALFLAGGLPWVKHFAFPVALILVAVVWPYRIEKGLTQGLMRLDAGLTVEILDWFDIPAIQRGNLIELSTGTVGVDEACSGIRSFQSSLMAALVMGELYRFFLLPRVALVFCGIVLGFGFNVVRTLLLSWQANKNGIGAIAKWHDPAGMTITVACFFALWALAVTMKRKLGDGSSKIGAGAKAGVATSVSQLSPPSPGGEGRGEGEPPSHLPSPNSYLPSSYLLTVGCCAVLSLAVTEMWYHSHSNPNSGKFYWTVAMPTNLPDFQKIDLPPRTLHLLAFDEGSTGKWTENGLEWNANFFRWKPRSIESVITSRIHRPERCLPAAGLNQVSESKLLWYDAGQFKLPFRKYVFEGDGHTLFVFFCQWEDGFKEQAGLQSSNEAGRLQSVLAGRRVVGQQTLELVLTGYPNLDDAEKAVREKLPSLIRAER